MSGTAARALASRGLLWWGALTACLTGPQRAAAQETPPETPPDRYVISVLTFGPGDAVFERFGHNAIRVRDRLTGSDLAYNWGMFSFDEPQFLRRFLSGDTRYWVAAFPSEALLRAYAERDRATVEQVLRLTPTQAESLAVAVERNARPENRYYRYDYFRDNCSTRVRDALDQALGGTLAPRFSAMRTEWTYRAESRRLSAPDPWAQAGIEVALGPAADRPLTAWESMFIPMRLRDHLRDVTVPSATGPVPLVSSERVLYEAKRPVERAEAGGLVLGPMGSMLTIWGLLLIPLTPTMRRRTRIPAAIMAAGWFLVTGLVGTLILAMWVGSAHLFWYRNLSLLLASPLGLVAAIPAARAVLAGRAAPWVRGVLWLLGAQAGLALVLAPLVSQRLAGPLLLLCGPTLAMVGVALAHTRTRTGPPLVR